MSLSTFNNVSGTSANVNMQSPPAGSISDSNYLENSIFNRNLNIWAMRLKDIAQENTGVFAVIGKDGFHKLDLISVVQYLKTINLFTHTMAVHHCLNPNFIYIKFTTPRFASQFKDFSTFIEGKRVYFVSGLETVKNVKIFIDKMPVDIIERDIQSQLAAWGTVTKIIPTTIPRPDGQECQIGQTKIEFLINNESTLSDLPYFVKLLNMRTYIYIPGRPKICFRCGDSSHLVSSCDKKFCPHCKRILPRLHRCSLSFAQKVQASESNWEVQIQRQLDDDNLVNMDISIAHSDAPVSGVVSQEGAAEILLPPSSVVSPLMESPFPSIGFSNSPVVSSGVPPSLTVAISGLTSNHDTKLSPDSSTVLDNIGAKRQKISGEISVLSVATPEESHSDFVVGTAPGTAGKSNASRKNKKRTDYQKVLDSASVPGKKIYPLRNKELLATSKKDPPSVELTDSFDVSNKPSDQLSVPTGDDSFPGTPKALNDRALIVTDKPPSDDSVLPSQEEKSDVFELG